MARACAGVVDEFGAIQHHVVLTLGRGVLRPVQNGRYVTASVSADMAVQPACSFFVRFILSDDRRTLHHERRGLRGFVWKSDPCLMAQLFLSWNKLGCRLAS